MALQVKCDEPTAKVGDAGSALRESVSAWLALGVLLAHQSWSLIEMVESCRVLERRQNSALNERGGQGRGVLEALPEVCDRVDPAAGQVTGLVLACRRIRHGQLHEILHLLADLQRHIEEQSEAREIGRKQFSAVHRLTHFVKVPQCLREGTAQFDSIDKKILQHLLADFAGELLDGLFLQFKKFLEVSGNGAPADR
jgi:hypothetical protein